MFACSIALVILLLLQVEALAQAPLGLDESCTVTVGNQTVIVRPDGTFLVRNISVFQSRDTGVAPQLYRVRATCLRDGGMITGQSEFFSLAPGQTTFVADVFPSELGPIPVAITVSAPVDSVPFGDSAQLSVIATLRDGRAEDVTSRSAGTTYLSTNPNLLAVTEDGLVVGANTGFPQTGAIAILNEGNVSTISFTTVGQSDDFDNDGMPNDYEDLFGLDKFVDDSGGDLDGDGLTNREEFEMGTIPNNPDTDGDGLQDSVDKDPLSPDEAAPIVSITFPENGATLVEGETITIAAKATDDGRVVRTDFLVEGSTLGSDVTSPFNLAFTVPAGVTMLRFGAIAVDTNNNRGVATEVLVSVVQKDPLTTVVGVVTDERGNELPGAMVETLNLSSLTQGDGTFIISGVPTIAGDIVAKAEARIDGQLKTGKSAPLKPVRGGITDVGTIVVSSLFLYPGQKFPVGDRPLSLAMTDLNGDGFSDLVTANTFSDDVSVLLGNGDGTFQDASSIPVGNGPLSVLVADLNLDGAADVITANQIREGISVLLGNGDGTFQDASSVAAELGGLEPVAVADVNADRRPDLVAANVLSDDVSILLGNGDGTFQDASSIPVGNGPLSVLVADLNLDGAADVITANQSSEDISVLLGNGDGTFQDASSIPIGEGGPKSVSLEIADLNLDGIPDFITGHRFFDNVSVLLGRGDGSFQSGQSFVFPDSSGGSSNTITDIAVSDVNTDGLPDVIIADGFASFFDFHVSVFVGNGDGTVEAPLSVAGGSGASSIEVEDLNGDSQSDLITTDPHSNDVVVLLGNGDGTFQTSFAASNTPGSVTLADINGDGMSDVLTPNFDSDDVSVFLGNGDSTFQDAITIAVGERPVSVAVADLNLDGVSDLVTGILGLSVFDPRTTPSGLFQGVSIRLGNGDGTFQTPLPVDVGIDPFHALSSIAVTDVNVDGLPDLVLAYLQSAFGEQVPDVSLLLGNGDGTFQSARSIFVTHPPFVFEGEPVSVAVADVNGDGFLDLVMAFGRFDRTARALLGNGDGTFQSPLRIIGNLTKVVAIEDLNRDGAPDLVMFGTDLPSILLGNGDGTFQESRSLAAALDFSSVFEAVVADVNSDSLPDVVTVNISTDDVSVLLGNGDGTFQESLRFAVGKAPKSVAVVDLNLDGLFDLVTANSRTNDISILIHR